MNFDVFPKHAKQIFAPLHLSLDDMIPYFGTTATVMHGYCMCLHDYQMYVHQYQRNVHGY